MDFKRTVLLFATLALCFLLFPADGFATGDHSYWTQKKAAAEANGKPIADGKLKPFAELIKDKVPIEGLFTFYHDTLDNSMLMSIRSDQIDKIFLCGESRSQAEGKFFDNHSMGETYPFYFSRIGNRMMMLEKNVRFRVDSSNVQFDAVQSAYSDHLLAATDVKSLPDDSTKAVLIDAADLFLQDAGNVSYLLGQEAHTGLKFDRPNSYFHEIKSFPENSEIAVRLHYSTPKPQTGNTLQNPYNFFHTYHYSLSSLPETDYVPRFADDRLGHFVTLYQDYTHLDTESPYVRYINRWNLKKKNPDARISEPVEPIVFWVDKAVPLEFRDAFAEGIEFWNTAFEKIGFRNAIVAKQMPDTADWDPADVRYSVVQWMVQPGGGYAVGPSRANPFTGQIYDADVRVSADFIRFIYTSAENWVVPMTSYSTPPDDFDLYEFDEPSDSTSTYDRYDQSEMFYQSETAREAAFGLAYISTLGDMADKDSVSRDYIHSYVVELVAHEVGHTLGFRHNFKASTIYTLEQLSDREFTRHHGTTGSIMDYMAPNISPPGLPQGEFYSSVPGPFDDWLIEYSYADFGAATPEEERDKIEAIAARGPGDPNLVYATDEDAFGYSIKSIDPLVNLHDLGADPLGFARLQVTRGKELWHDAIKEFEQPGTRYQKIYRVFQTGWRGYNSAAHIAPKYVGGLDLLRSHIGDTGSRDPFRVIPAAKQREAVQFLSRQLFAADAFDLPVDLVNKLQAEDLEDFTFSAYSRSQVDYPLHQRVLVIQNAALGNLYSPYVLNRLLNNLARVEKTAEKYTMYDLFTDIRHSIWGELDGPTNVNSYRRQLQLAHLGRLIMIYLSGANKYPTDARTLAANDLDILEKAANRAIKSNNIDEMTRAHFKEVVRQIESARNAQRTYLGF